MLLIEDLDKKILLYLKQRNDERKNKRLLQVNTVVFSQSV